jgi:hypothetical protein
MGESFLSSTTFDLYEIADSVTAIKEKATIRRSLTLRDMPEVAGSSPGAPGSRSEI